MGNGRNLNQKLKYCLKYAFILSLRMQDMLGRKTLNYGNFIYENLEKELEELIKLKLITESKNYYNYFLTEEGEKIALELLNQTLQSEEFSNLINSTPREVIQTWINSLEEGENVYFIDISHPLFYKVKDFCENLASLGLGARGYFLSSGELRDYSFFKKLLSFIK